MSKITIAVAFGAGYVLGTRAGRERYRAIKGRANAVWQSDTVQEQTAKAQSLAKEQAVKAKEVAKDRLPSSLGGRDDDPSSESSSASQHSGAGTSGGSADRELGTVNAPGSHQ